MKWPWEWTILLCIWRSLVTSAIKCYSCDGSCHRNQRCNCQTGLCDGPYCFSLRTHEYMRGYTVTKGCASRVPTDQFGCFADKQSGQVSCFCDKEYCNGAIDVQPPKHHELSNITCYDCSIHDLESNCFATCSDANYCRVNVDAKTSQCGYGYPRLPYMMWSRGFLQNSPAGGACVSVLEGKGYMSKICTCARNRCNDRSLLKLAQDDVIPSSDHQEDPLTSSRESYPPAYQTQLLSCYSCLEVSGGPIGPSACREHTCFGHFCTLTLRTIASLKSGLRYERIAGCLNTTHPELVLKGCYQQWTTDREEYIQCACSGHFCNKSLGKAYLESSGTRLTCISVFRQLGTNLILLLLTPLLSTTK